MAKDKDQNPAKPRKRKAPLIVAVVLLAIALVAAGVLVFRYWSQQNA